MVDSPRLLLELGDFAPEATGDSLRRTNAQIRDMLRARYPCVEDRGRADLVVMGARTPYQPLEGPPVMWIAHGALGDPGQWLMTIPHLRSCDTIALASASDRRIAEGLGGEPFCHTAMLPLLVDCDFFQPRPQRRQTVRAAYGLADDTPVLLSASTVTTQKGIQYGLMLLAEIRRRGVPAVLLLAGEGEPQEVAYLKDLAQRLGLTDAFRMLGQRSAAELCDLYQAADLCLHLSIHRKESFGLVPVEAQACGLPVLAAAWGGVRDTLLDGVTGHYAPSYLTEGGRRVNWLSLLEPALGLLGDPERRAAMGQAARQHAVARYGMDAYLGRLTAAVETAAARSTEGALPVRLSPAADPLLVAMAEQSLLHPDEDSAQLSERMGRHQGERVYDVIHRLMVSSERPGAHQGRPYAIVDAVASGADVHVLDPPFEGRVALSAVALRRYRDLRGIHNEHEPRHAESALTELMGCGLVGCG